MPLIVTFTCAARKPEQDKAVFFCQKEINTPQISKGEAP
jgi:hypothetical protein